MNAPGDPIESVIKRLHGVAFAVPADERGWFEHETYGHLPHNVCTDAADEIERLRAANKDCIDWFNEARREVERLREALEMVYDCAAFSAGVGNHLGHRVMNMCAVVLWDIQTTAQRDKK